MTFFKETKFLKRRIGEWPRITKETNISNGTKVFKKKQVSLKMPRSLRTEGFCNVETLFEETDFVVSKYAKVSGKCH